MKPASGCGISTIISVLLLCFLLFSSVFSSKDFREENKTSIEGNKLKNMHSINARLRKMNKPFVKSIKSPDGDIIDCVLFHLQPAFDIPEIRGKMSLTPPELPKGHDNAGNSQELKQLWNSNGESCPNGTIPVTRTTASDIISFSKFGKKYSRKDIPSSPAHEVYTFYLCFHYSKAITVLKITKRIICNWVIHAIQGLRHVEKRFVDNLRPYFMLQHAFGYANNGEFYGAKALLNIWKPIVDGDDFSLSQIWVLGDVPNRPVNSVEAGWQAYPSHNGDSLPRLFTYWTIYLLHVYGIIFQIYCYLWFNIQPNGYRSGCYNLECPGFVHTSTRISLGAAIAPVSTYNGQQYDVAFMIWKDPKSSNWWLKVGNEVIGYWPSSLFTDLRGHATTIEYGGEVFSTNLGSHTSTQMGSGHFPNEGYKKAAYARNLEVINYYNQLVDAPNLMTSAEKPNCYDVQSGFNNVWRNYIFFGGSGHSPNCP
ncbi:protein neprosin-like [Bidens hawaiensis]|uniref:protein neprosin-like n=1 Tax=Bidens hawaiensis TaxID=980011 RepID=UPI0040493329